MIHRIDTWLGTRVFHPPIIWLCQRTGMTQWAISAYAWMAAAFTLVARIREGEIGFAIAATLMAVISTVSAALWPNMRRRPALWFRVFIWALAMLDIVGRADGAGQSGGAFAWSLVWDAFALIGEYAKTIAIIPPRKRRERAPAGKEALP